ncbi:MAG: hypothetical protein EKK63_10050 [Acinetobacter sp.]|uniref:peptidoglycan-binding domain-containing protein n=1 Tax=Acinetobacter sp. TaxID=472 RepID=UPI000FA680B8|nr:hypothetical protein [Acinetobacter sp.]RUP39332.1 MAG: hypothetical protein EKK63_10050 [Acinetobacter sp.]
MITFKAGEYSKETEQLQLALNKNGFALTVDGIFGPTTNNAFAKYASDKGLSLGEAYTLLFSKPVKTKINWLGLFLPILMKGEKAMTKEFIMQLVRDGLKVLGSTALGVGIMAQDEWTIVASAASIVVGVIWGFVVRKDANAAK